MRLRYLGLAPLLAGVVGLAQPNPQPQAGAPAAAQPQAQVNVQVQPLRAMARPAPMRRGPGMQPRMEPGMQPQARPPLERALGGPAGRWWDNTDLAQRLLLTSDQQKKMDDVFQQYRLKQVDLNATAEREQLIMAPLVTAEQPDEAKIVAQIDKVAQAQAEVRKANARMLLGIRRVLSQDQWNKLKAETSNNPRPAAAPPRQNPPPRQPGLPGRGGMRLGNPPVR